METIQIKNRWTGAVMYNVEAASVCAAVVQLTKTGADLADANLAGADLACADLADANLAGADLTCAESFRYADAPDPIALRRAVAAHIRANPELHDQRSWGDGASDTACKTPCCVAGWACHLGGGARGEAVSSAATRLLFVDGLPMPPFEGSASRESILAALDAGRPVAEGGA